MGRASRGNGTAVAKRRAAVANGEYEIYRNRGAAARYLERVAELRRARDGGMHYLDGEGFLE